MKNTELDFILLYNLDIFHLTSEVMEIQLKYFVIFPCTWRIKFLNTSKSKAFLAMSSVTFHMYLNIGRDDGDDYNDRESSDED